MSDKLQTKPEPAEVLLYQTEDGQTRLEVAFRGETCWLSLNQLAELFQRDKSVISRHIKNFFEEGELMREGTVVKFATVQTEGAKTVHRQIEFFNLDVIISVGYRVKSHRGTQFRIWATQRLREFIVKGFAMDDDRLKRAGGGNYFDELLARIRDIRSAEKVFWRKVLDIYATSIDYDPGTEASLRFLATVPIDELNRIVVMWLDFAEDQAKHRKQVFMKDWEQKLDEFLRFNDRKVLPNAGKVSKQAAEKYAKAEYEQFEVRRRAYKESIGEVESIKQLEEAAKGSRQLEASKDPSDKEGSK